MDVTVVAAFLMASVLAASTVTGSSIMMSDLTWSECDPATAANASFRVHDLTVSSPLSIPGAVNVSLQASLSKTLPEDVLVVFRVASNSSFGPAFPRLIPCVDNQGSCAYNLHDLLTLTDQSSSITRQIVTALKGAGLPDQWPLGPVYISLSDVTITIPNMVHSLLDSLINTNNYFVNVTLISPAGLNYGCVRFNMPVHKECLGWLCPKDIDYVIEVMDKITSH